MNLFYEWSKGNPGALVFLMDLFSPANVSAETIHTANVLTNAESIRGTNLYVLYSDICKKDINLVNKLCRVVPVHLLEDACDRQDYSGRELLMEYIDGNEDNLVQHQGTPFDEELPATDGYTEDLTDEEQKDQDAFMQSSLHDFIVDLKNTTREDANDYITTVFEEEEANAMIELLNKKVAQNPNYVEELKGDITASKFKRLIGKSKAAELIKTIVDDVDNFN